MVDDVLMNAFHEELEKISGLSRSARRRLRGVRGGALGDVSDLLRKQDDFQRAGLGPYTERLQDLVEAGQGEQALSLIEALHPRGRAGATDALDVLTDSVSSRMSRAIDSASKGQSRRSNLVALSHRVLTSGRELSPARRKKLSSELDRALLPLGGLGGKALPPDRLHRQFAERVKRRRKMNRMRADRAMRKN